MARASRARESAPAEELLLPPNVAVEGTHRRVLEAALVAFGERGFHAVTVREIANRAKINVSSVYWHVPSKEEVLFELCLIGHESHAQAYTEAMAAAGPDPRERFIAFTDSHIRTHITYRMMARVSNRELHCLNAAHHRRIQVFRDRRSILEDLIVEGVEAGVFDAEDTWLAATTVLGLGHRVCEWWTPQIGVPSEVVVQGLVDHALRVVGAEPRPRSHGR